MSAAWPQSSILPDLALQLPTAPLASLSRSLRPALATLESFLPQACVHSVPTGLLLSPALSPSSFQEVHLLMHQLLRALPRLSQHLPSPSLTTVPGVAHLLIHPLNCALPSSERMSGQQQRKCSLRSREQTFRSQSRRAPGQGEAGGPETLPGSKVTTQVEDGPGQPWLCPAQQGTLGTWDTDLRQPEAWHFTEAGAQTSPAQEPGILQGLIQGRLEILKAQGPRF